MAINDFDVVTQFLGDSSKLFNQLFAAPEWQHGDQWSTADTDPGGRASKSV